MKKKVLYTFFIILSFFIGVCGTIALYYFLPFTKINTASREIKNVNITESNTIKESINKIYDAVVLVESFKNGQMISSGTGFIYKKDDSYGYILTNHHVIDSADAVKIINTSKEEVDAKILGSDDYADIAVLSINSKSVIQVSTIGDSTNLSIGDTLFTVGSPLGSEYMGTVTKGILSGKDRTVEVSSTNGKFMMEVLQTDAAINPGNSGGPLVNINGEVIGVNSMKLVKDEVEGMGFAIPIEMAMATVDRLEKGEKIDRPVIGIQALDVTDSYSLYRNQVYLKEDFDYGIVVIGVESNSSALEAGILKGDVLLKFNDVKIKDMAHFRFLLYKCSIGDTINVLLNRDGKEIKVSLKLSKSVG